jgi:fibronectin-binding autotransporter adhesin
MWSDISGNSAQNNGGGAWNSGTIDFLTSLIANNTLPTGTGVRGTQEGGGLYNIGNASLGTSSVAGNTASFSAGIYNKNASLYLTNVTVAYNSAVAGGKILFTSAQAGGLDSNGTGSSNLRNTLIANNTPGNCGQSPTRTVVSLGNNLDSGTQCNFAVAGDKQGVNPLLAPLANNGGTTRTLALVHGSPAIDAADNVYCGFYDQRGFSGPTPPGSSTIVRQVDGNLDGVAVCDIGAFEFVYHPPVFIPMVRR